MQLSQARPPASATIFCSGVEKAPGRWLRLLALMAEVDEHSEPGRVPPLHPADLIGCGGVRRRWFSGLRRGGRGFSDGQCGERSARAQQHFAAAYVQRIHACSLLRPVAAVYFAAESVFIESTAPLSTVKTCFHK